MNEADASHSTPAHESAVVIHAVVVRMFIRKDETCWVSASSIARLVGVDPVALCAEFALDDLAWMASRHDHIEPRNDVRLSIPVISARGVHSMASRYPALAELADELNAEVFGVFHDRVMLMRARADAIAAHERHTGALKALAAVLASKTCQEANVSFDPEFAQAVDDASAFFAGLTVEGGAL